MSALHMEPAQERFLQEVAARRTLVVGGNHVGRALSSLILLAASRKPTQEDPAVNPSTRETALFPSAEDAIKAGHVVPVETTAPPAEERAKPGRALKRKAASRQQRPARFKPDELAACLRHEAEARERKRRKAKATEKMKRLARARG